MPILYDILVFVEKAFSAISIPGGMAESVDATDLKSVDRKRSWEFNSPYPHFTKTCLSKSLCDRKLHIN